MSRGWGRPWVIFDWDNIFGAYQLALDAKELAYSQLAAVIKTKTAEGMVPNFWQPQSISYDRTEPMIGSKVLHAMFHKYKEPWIVELYERAIPPAFYTRPLPQGPWWRATSPPVSESAAPPTISALLSGW